MRFERAHDRMPEEPFTRIGVTVTFLRQDHRPSQPATALPLGCSIVRAAKPTVAFYRYLYNTVGAPYVWWLRRAMPDHEIAELLASPAVSLHTLYRDGEPAGFFELEDRSATVNISYFGLMPHAVGQGLGPAFLRATIDEAWRHGPRSITVNTCTADNPRALPTYLRAGFAQYRALREIWDVPNRLGLEIPAQLRV
ncbi:MAG TPA: GNAT family N-acetyltransferase [Acetobacteraceae bacterium]|nr:GNAT family N-acetyltransferase [Acetobacteraceae bacterium]